MEEKLAKPSSEYILSHTKNSWKSNAMFSVKFLKEISHFHCLLKVVVLKNQIRAHINQLLYPPQLWQSCKLV